MPVRATLALAILVAGSLGCAEPARPAWLPVPLRASVAKSVDAPVERGEGARPALLALVPSTARTPCDRADRWLFQTTEGPVVAGPGLASVEGQPSRVGVGRLTCIDRSGALLRFDESTGALEGLAFLLPGEWLAGDYLRYGGELYAVVARRGPSGVERGIVAQGVAGEKRRRVHTPFGAVRGDSVAPLGGLLLYTAADGLTATGTTADGAGHRDAWGVAAYRIAATVNLHVVVASAGGVDVIDARRSVRRLRELPSNEAARPVEALSARGDRACWSERWPDGTELWCAEVGARAKPAARLAKRPGATGGLALTERDLVWTEVLRGGATAVLAVPADGRTNLRVAD